MNFKYVYDSGADYAASSIASTFFMIYAMCVVICGLVSLASYVFRAMGFYTIAKSQGNENAWLAFIPIVRRYQQGQLAGDILLKTKTIQKPGIWFVGLPVAWGILSYLISMIMGIAVVGKIVQYGFAYSYNGYGFDLEDMIEGLVGFIIIYAILATAYQVIYKAFVILVDKAILEKYTTGNMPLIHAVFCAFVPLYEAICVFIMSRRIEKHNDEDGQAKGVYYNMPNGEEFSEKGMNTEGYVMNPVPQQVMDENTPEWKEAQVENKISEE